MTDAKRSVRCATPIATYTKPLILCARLLGVYASHKINLLSTPYHERQCADACWQSRYKRHIELGK